MQPTGLIKLVRKSTTITNTIITKMETAALMKSLLAGSIGGSIGVGVAYPFDTISTKAQVSRNGQQKANGFDIIKNIYTTDGLKGFFDGVLVTMIGQAIIKALQFGINETTLEYLNSKDKATTIIHVLLSTPTSKMIFAGILAGLIASFVVCPIELIKIRMQTQSNKKQTTSPEKKDDDYVTPEPVVYYNNELDCAKSIIRKEGWWVLLFHGLLITILREVPGFAIYFVVYGQLKQSFIATDSTSNSGAILKLIFGAIAGWAMWIPTYPIDIVKTKIQVQQVINDDNDNIINPTTSQTQQRRRQQQQSKGYSKNNSIWQITTQLYTSGGILAFFNGLQPKLVRAAVKHAVTFWVYEIMMNHMLLL